MRVIETDVCVVGSGAGGAVVAHAAAVAGRKTLIVERGPYFKSSEMSHDEIKMLSKLYKDGGLQLTTTMDTFVLQGSCVGGTTVLANNALFRVSDRVLDRWEQAGAVLDRQALWRSFDKIERQLGAGPANLSNMSSGSRLLKLGADATPGLKSHYMTKALGGCTGCGGCNIGCIWDHKPSALTTFIPWAEKLGARVLPETIVDRIKWKNGKVSGLNATTGPNHEKIFIRAKSFIIAGGAVGSSGLLLKSKIRKNVGRRLSFNLGAAVISEFPDPVDTFDGDQMSVYVEGDGFHLEPVHNPPGVSALLIPGWFSEHGDLMRKYRHLTYGGPLIATDPVGRVVHSPFFGTEETRFALPMENLATLKRGLKSLARAMFAAGAKRLILPTVHFKALDRVQDVDLIDSLVPTPKHISMGSAHPQGGNVLSNDPEIGVVDQDFAVHGFENLFVCDASVFTECIGVNPINTIMAVADYAAPRILARA